MVKPKKIIRNPPSESVKPSSPASSSFSPSASSTNSISDHSSSSKSNSATISPRSSCGPRKSRRRRSKIAKKIRKEERAMAVKLQRRATTTKEKLERDPFHPCNFNECNWCSEIFMNAQARLLHQRKKIPKGGLGAIKVIADAYLPVIRI